MEITVRMINGAYCDHMSTDLIQAEISLYKDHAGSRCIGKVYECGYTGEIWGHCEGKNFSSNLALKKSDQVADCIKQINEYYLTK